MSGNVWFLCATLASVFWGVSYALAGRLLQIGVSVPMVLLIETAFAAPVFLALACFRGTVRSDISLILSTPGAAVLTLGLVVTCVIAGFFIVTSIAGKNATLAALIEISYPLFTFAFVWLIFREVQLSWATAAGGLLILLGSLMVYLKC